MLTLNDQAAWIFKLDNDDTLQFSVLMYANSITYGLGLLSSSLSLASLVLLSSVLLLFLRTEFMFSAVALSVIPGVLFSLLSTRQFLVLSWELSSSLLLLSGQGLLSSTPDLAASTLLISWLLSLQGISMYLSRDQDSGWTSLKNMKTLLSVSGMALRGIKLKTLLRSTRFDAGHFIENAWK